MPSKFAFLPAARPTVLARSLPAAAAGRRRIEQALEIRGDGVAQGARVAVRAELLGPGDVISVNREMISRVEPKPGLIGFEPTYMPFVEFMDADFPWRFSLDNGSASGVKPWLVLIALEANEFTHTSGENGPLPRIEVENASQSLPNLAQSWAFAHVQAALPDGGGTVQASMTGSAGNHFSRLLCPRQLKERQAYTLFLVPAYEAGRLAGLGSSDKPGTPDQPAWAAASPESVLLPVYYQSRFITNASEDVEALLRRLKGYRADDSSEPGAARRVSAETPGYYDDYTGPSGASFFRQAALKQAGRVTPGLETERPLTERVSATLSQVIAGELGSPDVDGNDPLVAMPAYGFRFRPDAAPSRPKAEQSHWYDPINLDLKHRHAAGLGAETVRQNQEYFAKLCWEQYEELVEANQRIARLRTAEALGARLLAKHAVKIAPDTLLALGEPLQSYVLAEKDTPVSGFLQNKGVPTSFASRGLRRMASRRSVVRGTGSAAVRVVPAPALPGDKTPNSATSALQRESFQKQVLSERAERGLSISIEPSLRPLMKTQLFATSARPLASPVAAQEFESRSVAQSLLGTLARLPKIKAEFTIKGLKPAELESIRPIYRSPLITTPLAQRLTDLDPDSILTDASALKPDSVALFEENRAFVEAFMVGANHEMNQELRWREFPTDMRGTIFRRFWDRGRPADDAAADDIRAIHTWNGKLGTHFAPGDVDKAANLVVVIRSDLVRKLELPIIVLNEAAGTTWQRGGGTDHEAVFFGKLGPDVAYYGFDVSREHIVTTVRNRAFLVIYEPVGRLRFGLDVATVNTRKARRNTSLETLRFPLRALGRDERVVLMHSRTPAPVPAAPALWDDLSWAHMTLTAAKYIDFSRVLTIAGQPDYWGAAKTSASLARSFWQKPVAAVMPIARVL